jgi:ferredoxin
MPKVTVVDFMKEVLAEFEVEKGTKLLKALIDNGIDLVHSCGGVGKCTTCRVNIDRGTPTKQTQVQKERFKKLVDQGRTVFSEPTRIFLSCQLLVEEDMEVCPLERFNHVIHDSLGKDTEDEITPEPVWVDKEQEF